MNEMWVRDYHDAWRGPPELHIANPEKYLRLKFYTQNNTWHQNIRLKYLNTDFFNQTDFKTKKTYVTDLLTQKNTKGVNFNPKDMSDAP